jgi:hypothetical protein
MFMRMSRARFVPGTEDDVRRIVDEQLVPVMQSLPGFQRYLGLINRSAGTMCAVSFWDNEANANFSRDVLKGAVTAVMALGATLEPAEIYEIDVDSSQHAA